MGTEPTAQRGIRLVTRGDDPGTCQSANRAVHDACVDGILRNASVMAPGAALDHAAELLADLPGLCIGLHTTLSTEFVGERRLRPVLPVEQVPSIVGADGYFLQGTWHLAQQRPVIAELMAEFRAQIALLRDKGMNVEYVDVHMGMPALPELIDEMARTTEREGLILTRTAPAGRLPRLEGTFDTPVQALLAKLEAAEPGDYVFVGHPCYDTEDVRALWQGASETVGEERDWQRRTFMDAEVLDYCRRRGVQPIRYTDLPVD
jgi:predicted glycoside hydrolase/deacetylase ChbG (UPF0249 family)